MRLGAAVVAAAAIGASADIPVVRRKYSDRTFHSVAIDGVVDKLAPQLKDGISQLFTNCFPNTLDTTVLHHTPTPPLDTFVITGDIAALWLRDSMNQVLPYIPYAPKDAALDTLVCGLLQRHSRSVKLDGYANAFNYNDNSEPPGHQTDQRRPAMTRAVWEGKYELDSLAAFLKLSAEYWEHTNNTGCFDDVWFTGVKAAVDVIKRQQQSTDEDEASGWWYYFRRTTSEASDTLIQFGMGPAAARTNMSKSCFRGSDDAQTLPFHIPANAMTVVELRRVSKILGTKPDWKDMAAATSQLAEEIDSGIQKHGVTAGGVYAYEADGFGSQMFMDDANVPSLLSLPELGYVAANDSVYLRTRAAVLSRKTNPFYFSGSAGAGVGGPHVGYGQVWPLAIITQAITSTDEDEIKRCLDTLVASSAGTGFLHESFDENNVNKFTRKWFAWVNTYFGRLVLKLVDEYPALVLKDPSRAAEVQREMRQLRA